MIEMAVVVALIMIVTSITVMSLRPALKDAQVNSAYSTVLSQLRTARERAIAERKRYIVTFTAPQTITTTRWDFALPVSPAPVFVQSTTLPQAEVNFQVIAGMPAGAAVVPDGFGNGTASIDFDQGVGAGGLNYVMFMPDGSSQDTLGNWNSGILYLARTNELYSGKAITVMGATGRIRGWRLINKAAVPTWIQQ